MEYAGNLQYCFLKLLYSRLKIREKTTDTEELFINTSAGAVSGNDSWTLLSNYAHVLVCLSRNPTSRLRDVAQQVRITERAVQRIVSELELADVPTRIRDGRRNYYELHLNRPLRHPLESHCSIGELLTVLDASPARKK